MTDEALRVLALLAETTDGRIEAYRVYPHPYKFKLHRAKGGAVEVTLSTIDQLVRAHYITVSGDSDMRADRYTYMLTSGGRDAVALHAADRLWSGRSISARKRDLR